MWLFWWVILFLLWDETDCLRRQPERHAEPERHADGPIDGDRGRGFWYFDFSFIGLYSTSLVDGIEFVDTSKGESSGSNVGWESDPTSKCLEGLGSDVAWYDESFFLESANAVAWSHECSFFFSLGFVLGCTSGTLLFNRYMRDKFEGGPVLLSFDRESIYQLRLLYWNVSEKNKVYSSFWGDEHTIRNKFNA
jgi:hypothetical protein